MSRFMTGKNKEVDMRKFVMKACLIAAVYFVFMK